MSNHSNPVDPTGREDEDVFNVVYQVELRDAPGRGVETYLLADDAVYQQDNEPKRVDEPAPQQFRNKIHPKLREWLDGRSGDEREQIIVVLADPRTIPRFPEPANDEPSDSDRNRRLRERAQELVRSIERERAPAYERLEDELADLDATVVERFWLINGVVVDMPLRSVERLARREDVLSIEPRFSGEQPPQREVVDGRAVINSDPYFNLGLTGGRIGLLDTGVRFSHSVFTNPSNIDLRRDCSNGGADCNTGTHLNPNDDYWSHGTATAAIIVANDNLGNGFRGVTAIILDSFKVYLSGSGGLDAQAAVFGFQNAVAQLDRVIVAEMQGNGDHLSAIANAADAAFDAGAVVIAANGNNGPKASTVNCPANARRAIGVGSFDVRTLKQVPYQSRGPTADGRFKPDIQAPTNTVTASNASDTATQPLTGTSGATPYASGAAAQLRNWLCRTSSSIDPGQVYAQLILSGQRPYPFDNTSGAGPLRLQPDGIAWWGKVNVTNNAIIDIPINVVSGTANTLNAALWWPEINGHNHIDLHLMDPAGNTRASSIAASSVYERCQVAGAVQAGTWQVRIQGVSVPVGQQTVYWAAQVRQ
jgi:serine protease AprX